MSARLAGLYIRPMPDANVPQRSSIGRRIRHLAFAAVISLVVGALPASAETSVFQDVPSCVGWVLLQSQTVQVEPPNANHPNSFYVNYLLTTPAGNDDFAYKIVVSTPDGGFAAPAATVSTKSSAAGDFFVPAKTGKYTFEFQVNVFRKLLSCRDSYVVALPDPLSVGRLPSVSRLVPPTTAPIKVGGASVKPQATAGNSAVSGLVTTTTLVPTTTLATTTTAATTSTTVAITTTTAKSTTAPVVTTTLVPTATTAPATTIAVVTTIAPPAPTSTTPAVASSQTTVKKTTKKKTVAKATKKTAKKTTKKKPR